MWVELTDDVHVVSLLFVVANSGQLLPSWGQCKLGSRLGQVEWTHYSAVLAAVKTLLQTTSILHQQEHETDTPTLPMTPCMN